jgi:alpha-beta hydrolase superfamily lysophospholipase
MHTSNIQLMNGELVGKWRHAQSKDRLIIICHGYQGSNEDPTIVAIAEGLNRNGLDTFTFNFSKNRGGIDIEHQVTDISAIIEYFSSYDQIILLAGSFAASPATIAALHFSTIKGLMTLNGFFGTGELGHKHRRNYAIFRILALVSPKYRKILKYLRSELRPECITIPILVMHAAADEYVFKNQSQNFYAAIKSPKTFIELQTANHGVTSPEDRNEVIQEITDWLATKI